MTTGKVCRYFSPGSNTPDRAWVYIDGRDSAVSCDVYGKTDDEAIAQAVKFWERRDYENALADSVRSKSGNRQVFSGDLPCADVEWNGEPGWYTYTLKDRRRHGKHQVLEAQK